MNFWRNYFDLYPRKLRGQRFAPLLLALRWGLLALLFLVGFIIGQVEEFLISIGLVALEDGGQQLESELLVRGRYALGFLAEQTPFEALDRFERVQVQLPVLFALGRESLVFGFELNDSLLDAGRDCHR